MRISYAITVCNEIVEIRRLVEFLLSHKRNEDEIVILFDSRNGLKEVEEYLRSHSVNGEFNWHKFRFYNHFADWKNRLTSLCSGDFILQIDADEVPNETLIEYLPEILDSNPDVDVYLVPRINTVKGITSEHISKWGWNVNEKGYINYPDFQWRIYRNNNKIYWTNKVHEKLVGYNQYSYLPIAEAFCLYHHKDIERQERQNALYEKI
jgi:hypothetical protein